MYEHEYMDRIVHSRAPESPSTHIPVSLCLPELSNPSRSALGRSISISPSMVRRRRSDVPI